MSRIPGFRFAGVRAGIKKKPGLDLGLLACDSTSSTAAVFTRNRVKAAPVRLSTRHLARAGGNIAAIVVNSGNANACTGPQGTRDAAAMAQRTAHALGVPAHTVLVCSTGVIGQPLPMTNVERGIADAAASLRANHTNAFAKAILTTDKRAKTATRTLVVNRQKLTLWGCTKGAGMIMPNMATTLTFVATDATIAPNVLQGMVAQATEATFNAIAVDGDTSTNDTLAVMASNQSGPRIARAASPAGRAFADALTALLADLATQLMRDGEGVHHVVTIRVRGAASVRAAQTVARRVAISPLVKTAIAGADPNWGRILCAVGNAGVALRPDRIGLTLAGVETVRQGALVPRWREAEAARKMRAPAYEIVIDLGAGSAQAHYLACDLSHGYVSINADYRS